jgi:hypothetical protein
MSSSTPPTRSGSDPTMFIILAVIVIVAIVLAIVFFSNPATPSATATLDSGINTTDIGVTDINDEMTEVEQTMPGGTPDAESSPDAASSPDTTEAP